ncbi:MAG: acylphosphatase, partial [Candidatus Schekmanbacteria bacterium RBG_16_38_11]
VKGYVKNLINGGVEAIAEGERETIEKFIESLKRGPSFSKVVDVEIEWEDYKGEFKGFDIRF